MTWRETTAIVWIGFSLGALTDTALRSRIAGLPAGGHYGPAEAGDHGPAEAGHYSPPEDRRDSQTAKSDVVSGFSRTNKENDAIATTGVATESAVDVLRKRHLDVPVEGVHRKDLHDTFADTRTGAREHEALDIMAARRTPVRAVEDGQVEKLFTSKAGGLTIYQFEPTGTFCYYYAHLDAYAAGLREGQRVRKGDVIGYVGSTGNASPDAPHLHFAIFRLTPERRWWKGEPVNPYDVLR